MMLKKISFMISILFFLVGTNVFAHSHLEDSSPKNGEIVTEPLKDITLTYETKIEAASTFTLKDQSGTDIPLSKISVNNNQLVGTLKDELANGGYTIHWKIIGSDGHPLEGNIPFSMRLPETQAASETVPAATESTSNNDEATTANEEKETAADTKQANAAAALTEKSVTEEVSLKDYLIPASAGLLIVLGAGSYWLFYRRKHV
jgi:copper resistance protein C